MAGEINMFSNEVLATRIDNLVREFKDYKNDNKEDHKQVLQSIENLGRDIRALNESIAQVSKEVQANSMFRRLAVAISAIVAPLGLAKVFDVW